MTLHLDRSAWLRELIKAGLTRYEVEAAFLAAGEQPAIGSRLVDDEGDTWVREGYGWRCYPDGEAWVSWEDLSGTYHLRFEGVAA